MDTQHPFAQFIRILGRGQQGSRALTQEEAHAAMGMILDGLVEPVQLGAFLMLVRIKEESPEEVAGFVRAVRERIVMPESMPAVDLDWSSYAGKRRQLPWFILTVLLLVDNGVKVFMHGLQGHKDDRLYTPEALTALGIPVSDSLSDAANRINTTGFAYLNLDRLFPQLQQLIDLRDYLGLRTPVHTVARMINPFQALYQMQGIFHPGYQEIHQGAAALLEQPHMVVIKGDGGEIEVNPDAECTLHAVHEGTQLQETWPALFERRHTKPEQLDITLLAKVWRGEYVDEYGRAAVIATTAVTLYMMGRASDRASAFEIAETLWRKRSKSLI